MRNFDTYSGFTLIEILLSLFIMMLVAFMVSTGLNFIASSTKRLEHKAKMIGALQSTIQTIENDFRQIRRPSTLLSGSSGQPALTLSDTFLQLTSGAMINPSTGFENSALQTITYQRVGTKLVRFSIGKKLNYRVILTGIKAFNYQVIPAINPLTQPSSPTLNNIKVKTGILLDIETIEYGHIRRLIALAINTTDPEPGGGFASS